jgi:hypothetical protein
VPSQPLTLLVPGALFKGLRALCASMSYSANAIDQHNPEQVPFLPDNFYPRLLAHYQSQNAYAQTMAQPAFVSLLR